MLKLTTGHFKNGKNTFVKGTLINHLHILKIHEQLCDVASHSDSLKIR